MTTTPAATALLAIACASGLKPYDVLSGNHRTTKMARYRLPNGQPIAIQTDNKVPRLWVLTDQEKGAFSDLGKRENYAAGRPRHHHLNQVREFIGQPLTKVEVSTASWPVIRAAFAAITKVL
jgi:hypothetical protein